MKQTRRWLSFLMLAIFAGCSFAGSVETTKSSKPRLPVSTPADSGAALTDGNTAFAFALYQALRKQPGNLFYSPYSISTALAMTYVGAHGETEKQMAQTLHFALPQDRLHPAFNWLEQSLTGREKDLSRKEAGDYQLDIANALWGQKDYSFLPAFLDVLAQNYGAGMNLVDFKNNSEAARQTINAWVSKATNNKIKDLIAPQVLNSATRLVLTNAVYFKDKWAYTFEKADTHSAPFTLLDSKKIAADMMSQSHFLGYAQGKGWQAVELPYRYGQLSFIALLPSAGSFSQFEQSLEGKKVKSMLAALSPREVDLTMPKFKYDSQFSLADTLKALGMPAAFDPNAADFSGMSNERPGLFISAVIHKAMIAVDETGTEAAAATAVAMAASAAPFGEGPIVVNIDRPFIFFIRDEQTGAILFVGRVLNPKE